MNNNARANFIAEFRLLTADCSDGTLDSLVSAHFPVLARTAQEIVRAFLRYILRRKDASGDVWQDLRYLELEAIIAEHPEPSAPKLLATIHAA